jgi:hypothetical protein
VQIFLARIAAFPWKTKVIEKAAAMMLVITQEVKS